jgi:hypothetical protein
VERVSALGEGRGEGSSSGKDFGTRRGKRGRKGPPIVWEGSVGPESYSEAVYEFSFQLRAKMNSPNRSSQRIR